MYGACPEAILAMPSLSWDETRINWVEAKVFGFCVWARPAETVVGRER